MSFRELCNMAILRPAASCQTRVNTKTAAANINNRHKLSVILLNSMQQHAQLSPAELLATCNIHRPIRHSLQGSHPSITTNINPIAFQTLPSNRAANQQFPYTDL